MQYINIIYIMNYVTPYHNIKNEYKYVISRRTCSDLPCDMIMIYDELTLNEITILDNFMPSVLNTVILEYARSSISFTLNFTSIHYVHIWYDDLHISTINFSILDNNKLIVYNNNVRNQIHNNILHKLLVTCTTSWLKNINNILH